MRPGLDNTSYSLTNNGKNGTRRELLWLGAITSPFSASWLPPSSFPPSRDKNYFFFPSVTSSLLEGHQGFSDQWSVYIFKSILSGPPLKQFNSNSSPPSRTGANKCESAFSFQRKIKNRTGTRVQVHRLSGPALVLSRATSGYTLEGSPPAWGERQQGLPWKLRGGLASRGFLLGLLCG